MEGEVPAEPRLTLRFALHVWFGSLHSEPSNHGRFEKPGNTPASPSKMAFSPWNEGLWGEDGGDREAQVGKGYGPGGFGFVVGGDDFCSFSAQAQQFDRARLRPNAPALMKDEQNILMLPRWARQENPPSTMSYRPMISPSAMYASWVRSGVSAIGFVSAIFPLLRSAG